MKKFLWQITVILSLSLFLGLGYNQLSKSPLPIFQKYDAHRVDISINNTSGEDPVVYLNEIDAETVQSLVESNMAILLDARPPEEFASGHIPNAVSLPISRFEKSYHRAAVLLAGCNTIITYCEGFHCTDSSMLAMELHKKGYQDIFIYKGGIEEWMERGYPVETANGVRIDNQESTIDD
jgi:rhodanese-related sulfurtransferase